MLKFKQDDLKLSAEKLLKMQPDPVPRFRLLRDVLHDDPILKRVQPVILDYMEGKYIWPDPPEKHDNPLGWYKWVPQVSAAVLAQFDRYHPRLEKFWTLWAETVQVSFQSGVYDRRAEIEVLNRLLDCRMKNPVPFHVKYPLLILSATANRLPEALERLVLDFIMNSPNGIYYIFDRKINDLIPLQDKRFWGWIRAHSLLSRFHLYPELAQVWFTTGTGEKK